MIYSLLLLSSRKTLLNVLVSTVALLLFASAALACGASGGNNSGNRDQIICNPDAQPANHRGTGPASATAFSIDLITGNKYFAHTDAKWPGGLHFTRHYNSRNTFEQALGPAWRHSYETALAHNQTTDGQWRIQIIQADGRRIVFKPTHVNNMYQSLEPGYGTVRRQPNASRERRYTWQWRDGSTLSFDELGRLRATERRNGQKLSLTYEDEQLSVVTNRHGQSMQFDYLNQRLSQVTLPNKQQLRFEYDPQRVLTRVHRNSNTLWQYQYADNFLWAVAKVIDANGKLSATVQYDDAGRAIASAPGGDYQSAQAVRLKYQLPVSVNAPGSTTVLGAHGKSASYQWRYNPRTQQRELLNSSGEQCVACPATGIARRYDQAGKLVATQKKTLSPSRRRWRYDRFGRLSGITVNKQGKRTKPLWRTYQYASDQPDATVRRIESPSRAPGKKHRVELRYNAMNQLISRREIGFEPDLSTLTVQSGHWRIGRWRQISRSWHYRYAKRGAAQGLLLSVDGPLPGDTDKTSFRYDNAGYLIEKTEPGNQSTQHTYDAAGFLASSISPAGDIIRYGRNAQGSVVRVINRQSRTDYQRDNLEKVVGIARSDQPEIHLEMNSAGHLKTIRDNNGNSLSLTTPPGTTPVPSTSSPKLNFEHAGSAIKVSKIRTNESTIFLLDDFGRRVAAKDSVSGIRRWVYDEADRLVASTDQSQNPVFRRYDNTGNLVGTVDSRGKREHTVWQDGRKISSTETHQKTVWHYTPNTRNYTKRIEYSDPVSGLGFSNTYFISHKHNRQGQLKTRILPNNDKLQYEWNTHNQLRSINLNLSDGTVINLVDQLTWLPFTGGQHGLRGAQFGNGTNQTIQLDNRIRVTDVVHGPADDLPRQHLKYNDVGRLVAQTISGREERFAYSDQGRLKRPLTRQLLTNSPKVHWLTDANGRVRWSTNETGQFWRYVFNNAGERIGKININDPSKSRWFIYDQQRLLAETDSAGNPIAVYLYLDNRPFVMLRYDETTSTTSGRPSVFWLHTDHRGLPLAATNKDGNVVWQGRFTPYGQQLPAGPKLPGIHPISTHVTNDQQFEMPLRLPGQYYDPETGLHDNYLRTYNPATGNYLGPDPLGMRANGERFAYARHSPMDTTDPLGLYEIDVHYYMTYFLAVAAGIDPETASVIAHATQGIDTNNDTEPVNTGSDGNASWPELLISITNNQTRLLSYHFTLTRIEEVTVFDEINMRHVTRLRVVTPTSTDVRNPGSPQLDRLANAYQSANNPCTGAQLLGEYLHAFQDTFSHRDRSNRPIRATQLGFGVGHGTSGHHPDYTYNHGSWQVNEARTLRMEQETYELLTQYGDPRNAIPWDQIVQLMEMFNKERSARKKVEYLNSFLGLSAVVPMETFLPTRASARREQFLCGSENSFNSDGVITPSTCNQ